MAGRIPDRDIAAIRERVRIEDVVGDYVQLRRAGADSLKGLCPFHDEKSPSFHVRPNHGHFHCFGCGEGGDVYAFVQKIEHVSFVEAVELLADRVGLHRHLHRRGGDERAARPGQPQPAAGRQRRRPGVLCRRRCSPRRPRRRVSTCIERNFDAETAAHFGCGFAPSGWDIADKASAAQGV